jgi:hypothetical protein
MTVEQQVSYETSVRMRQAVIAGVASVLIIVSAFITLSGTHTNVDELTLDLITAHKRFPLDLIGYVVDGVGLGALGLTLIWLDRISVARNPEIKSFIRWLAILGSVLSATMPIAYEAVIAVKAHDFVSSGTQTYLQANALTSGGLLLVLPLLAQFGSLLLTGGFIWISLNGMRVGLLTRYLGYTGVIAGALLLFPLVPVPVVQAFWLGACAVLFAGRWPTGMPPAWEAGVSIPWPGSAGASPQRVSRNERAAREGAADKSAPVRTKRQPAAPAGKGSTNGDGADAPARTRANTPKRKRKRRN